MDIVSRLRPYSMVFLVLAVIFGGIAAGVVPPPASGVVTGEYGSVNVSGGNIESATWSYNPYTKTWHFEIIAGASTYQMVIALPEQRVEGADGAYEVEPYTLTVDLSKLYYALPMQQDPSRVVYRYRYVDCGEVKVPYNAWVDLATRLTSFFSAGTSRMLYDLFQSSAVKSAYVQAYESCKDTVDSVVSSMNAKYADGYVLLSVDKSTESISVLGFTIYSATVYNPHFYGVVKYQTDTWSPKVSGALYPVGTVTVNISGKEGSASATLVLNDTSADLQVGDGVSASAQLPVADGYIRYVGYIQSTGDVYHLSDPWVINYEGRYVPVESSRLVDYMGLSRQLDDYLSSGSAKDYLVSSSVSFDDFISSVGSYGLDGYADESQVVREEIKRMVAGLDASLDNVVENSSWSKYVVSDDVPSYGILQLRPPSASAPAFKLLLAGDVDAEWIGLRPLPAVGKIVDYPSEPVTATRDGGVAFQFTIKNVADVDGALDWSVTCGSYGILASGTTPIIRSGAALTIPVSGYLTGIADLSKEQQVQCKITVSNLFGDVTDSASVYVQYKPDVVCQYGVPTCATKDGMEGYYYCESPYKPAVFQPCPSGQVCQMSEEGAKCVVPTKEEENVETTLSFCSGDEICYIVDGRKECEPCPNGGTCTYVRGEGASCTGGMTAYTPPSKDVVYVSPASGRVDLWRVGAAIAAFGSLIVWVVLV